MRNVKRCCLSVSCISARVTLDVYVSVLKKSVFVTCRFSLFASFFRTSFTQSLKNQITQLILPHLQFPLTQRDHQEKEATFTPRISRASKALRRDMPVVERLFMLEQVFDDYHQD